MRILEVEAVPLRAGFARAFSFGTTDRTRSFNVLVRVTTDEGLVGLGEACPVPAFTAETQESVVAAVEQRMRPVLEGMNPLQREPLLRRLQARLAGYPFTLAAIDMALLDLAG